MFNLVVFFLGLTLRATVTVFNLDYELNTNKLQVLNVTVCPELHVMVLTINIVVLGVAMFLIYGLSILNSLHWLNQIRRLGDRNILTLREVWINWGVVMATCTSMIDAIGFFFFVREMWVANLNVVIQVLQVIPSLAVILDTMLCGMLLFVRKLLTF